MRPPDGETVALTGTTCVVGAATVAVASSSDQTGPILAFAGALTVALITAVTAQRRLRSQLAAEEGRLASQLRHDRTLRDLDELRSLLDEAAVGAASAMSAFLDLSVKAQLVSDPADLDAGKRDLESAQEPMFVMYQRMLIRIRSDDATDAYFATVKLLYPARILDVFNESAPGDERSRRLAERRTEVSVSYGKFLERAERLVGSRVTDDGD
jgi:hypothetical protein